MNIRPFTRLAKALGEDDFTPPKVPEFHVIDRDQYTIIERALRNHLDMCKSMSHEMRVRDHAAAELTCRMEAQKTRDLLELIEQSHEIRLMPE